MTLQKPSKPSCLSRRPVASSSRDSGSSQASSSEDIELPAYSDSQPFPPLPPSYDHPEGLFPNYRSEKQGPDTSVEPAAIEEGRAVPAAPAVPAAARIPPARPNAQAAVPVQAPARAQPAPRAPRTPPTRAQIYIRLLMYGLLCVGCIYILVWMLLWIRRQRNQPPGESGPVETGKPAADDYSDFVDVAD